MSYFKLEKKQSYFILWLDNGENDNAFRTDVLEEFNRHLDEVEKYEGDTCLMFTSDHPKTFSTGIDLEWLFKQPKEELMSFVRLLDRTLLRVALFNAPTLSVINGNAYGGGAMLATACDFRIMRQDRGRYCLPEVKIKSAFTPTMVEIIRLIPDVHSMHRLALTADAVGGEECLPMKVVDAIYPQAQLFEEGCQLAETLATKHRPTYTKVKQDIRRYLVEFQNKHFE